MIETFYKIPYAPHLALLSDLHNRPYSAIIDFLRVHRPSIIAIAGDVLYGSHPGNISPLSSQTNILPFLSACSSIAPAYFSLGNHEWMLDAEDIETIRGTEAVVLDNEWIVKDGLVIGGLTSGYVLSYRRFLASLGSKEDRYPKEPSVSSVGGLVISHDPDLSWIDDYCSVLGYHLLLSHHPEYWNQIKGKNIQLVGSGHAHGGQWRFFGRGVFAPGQGWFPTYTKGVYDNRLVISTGLSNTAFVPRLFNPTEIVYVEA